MWNDPDWGGGIQPLESRLAGAIPFFFFGGEFEFG